MRALNLGTGVVTIGGARALEPRSDVQFENGVGCQFVHGLEGPRPSTFAVDLVSFVRFPG